VITINVPIKDLKKPPKLTFPDRCVNCGLPKVRTWALKLNTGAQKRGQQVQLELDVPLCADCVAKENRIGNVTWLPFFIVGFLVCAIVYIPALLISPEGTTPQTYNFPFVFGLMVGLILGSAVGTLVEFGLRLLFAPVYGKLLRKRPLTVVSVLRDTEDLIGIAARFSDGRKKIRLIFENDEIANEFATLNGLESV
jgi:hypothetical protein